MMERRDELKSIVRDAREGKIKFSLTICDLLDEIIDKIFQPKKRRGKHDEGR